MSIRTKTVLIISLTLLSLIAVLYAFSQIILMNSYVELERETVALNVERAENAIEDEIAFLDSTNLDWAHWDDTYQFIQGENPTYIEDNIYDSVFGYYQLNFILIVDDSGEIIYSHAYDLDAQAEAPVSDSLTELVSHNESLYRPVDENGAVMIDGVSGILVLPDGGLLLASTPIMPSDVSSGEPIGALVWGRYLTESVTSALAEQTQLDLSLVPLAEQLPSSDAASSAQVVIEPLNGETIAGATVLRDLHGAPAMSLTVEMPRSIYQQGQSSLSYFLLSLVLVGVISAVAIAIMLERGVLSRLAMLNAHVSHIQQSGDLSARVPVAGDDELTSLATNINAMAESLQAQEKIKLARDNALEAARLKAEILANVSHDARTPLTVILLRADMMRKGIYGALTTRQGEVLDSILTSSHQLLGFINNLLEGAQLETGKLKLNMSEVSPAALLATIASTLEPLAARKSLQLNTELDPDVPAVICGDEKRLEQILTNLVTNAIKFTEAGAVTARMYTPDAAHWALEVRDTGVGISAEHQTQIFTPFWQVDGSKTRAANLGVGLGLAIVQQLTELMGGDIRVSSAPGAGSTFTVVLPLQTVEKGIDHAEAAIRISH